MRYANFEEENIKINNKINKKNISPSSYDIIVEGEDDLKKIIDNNNIKNTNIKDYPKKKKIKKMKKKGIKQKKIMI